MPEFKQKFGSLSTELAVRSYERKTIFYYPYFLIRRWVTVFAIVLMGTNTGLQFFALLNINKASIIFYGWMNPHWSKGRKRLEFFNDAILMLLSYSMLSMTSFLLYVEVIFYMGYVFISQFVILAVVNLSYIFIHIHQRYNRQKRMRKLE